MNTSPSTVNSARVTIALAFIILAVWMYVEGVAVGSGQPNTFSDFYRTYVRFNIVGRPITWMALCWVTWHLGVQPLIMAPGFSWRDPVALGLGVGLALAEIALRLPRYA